MESKPMLERCRDAVVFLFLCALGLRIAAWLIAPVLPIIGGLFLALAVIWWAVAGPRARP